MRESPEPNGLHEGDEKLEEEVEGDTREDATVESENTTQSRVLEGAGPDIEPEMGEEVVAQTKPDYDPEDEGGAKTGYNLDDGISNLPENSKYISNLLVDELGARMDSQDNLVPDIQGQIDVDVNKERGYVGIKYTLEDDPTTTEPEILLPLLGKAPEEVIQAILEDNTSYSDADVSQDGVVSFRFAYPVEDLEPGTEEAGEIVGYLDPATDER